MLVKVTIQAQSPSAELRLSHKIIKHWASPTPSCRQESSSILTVNFPMYRLDLEKAEEPEIKSPTSVGS